MIKILREKYKKYLVVKILVVITVVLLSVGIIAPLVKLAALFGINIQENTGLNFKPSLGLIFFTFLFGLCSFIVIWLAQRYIHQKPLSQLGFKSKIGRDVFLGFLIGIIIVSAKYIIYGISAKTIEYNPITVPNDVSIITYIGYYIHFIIGFIICNSFIEEFVTRAYPIEKLKNHINPHVIFIIMGLIFTFGHLITREFNIHYCIAIFGYSYVFSLLYFYSRSIWLVAGVHAGVNWINFTFFGTNWKIGGLYTIKISNFPTWIYDYTDIFIYLTIITLIIWLSRKGFFRKYFPVTNQ